MAQIKKGDAHGCKAVQIALMGTDGYAYGQSGYGQTANTVSGAYLANTPKSATIPAPDRNVIEFTGGDKWLGSFQYGFSSVGAFDVVMSGYDADLIALVTGASVDQTTNEDWSIFSENDFQTSMPQVCALVTYRIQARGTNEGADLYITSVISRGWMSPKGITGAPAFQAAGEYTYSMTPTAATQLPNGMLFSATAMNLAEDKTFRTHIISNYPIALATYIADGSATTFTLPYKPVSSVVTVNDTPNFMTVNATPTAASAVSTSTGQVTLSAAGTSGDVVVMLYETNFVPST